jgi:6-phosphogluconolactonase/glucosamine-6-phosphate isomerase/deaminase
MASGQKKADIMAKGLGQPPTEEIPVSIAQLIPHGYVMLDEDAASKLTF